MKQWLEAVETIAVDAGQAILAIYNTDFTVETKHDRSPLTQADLAANRLIVDGLQRLEPRYPVLSEENAHPPYATRQGWTRYWLVDPLDGTREFVKRNGEFTVNIALIEDGLPILGVVHAPVSGKTYVAARGVGARLVEASGRRTLRARRLDGEPTFIVSRSHRDAALQALLDRLPAHDAVFCGSSLKFCLIAEGCADLYPRTGPTSEWDTAAGQCVAEQAGALVLTLPALEPLRYNQKDSLLNPGFVVIADPDAGWPSQLRA